MTFVSYNLIFKNVFGITTIVIKKKKRLNFIRRGAPTTIYCSKIETMQLNILRHPSQNGIWHGLTSTQITQYKEC